MGKLRRIFSSTLTFPPPPTLRLSKEKSHYLTNVLRLKLGEIVSLFNGGREFLTEIVLMKPLVEVRVIEEKSDGIRLESPLRIHLIQSVVKGDKMDFMIQKAVELGVVRITPLFTPRTNVKLNEERLSSKMEHWKGVIESAAEQCGRRIIPSLSSPISFNSFDQQFLDQQFLEKEFEMNQIDQDNKDFSSLVQSFVLHPDSTNKISSLSFTEKNIRLLIGPEGGFSKEEIEKFQGFGFSKISLGPRILRAETATISALSIFQSKFGDI